MSSLPDGARASVPDIGADRHRARSQSLAAVCAALVGLLLVYGAGFAETEEIHNGAHDSRHAAGFPCH
jgi:cobalt transporter subunit CbtB